MALLLVLALPLALPLRCVCGEALDKAGTHLALCKHEGGAILRHDRVVDLLQQLCHAAGVVCAKEVSHWVEDNTRLDLVLLEHGSGGRDVALDVKIVNPMAAGALASGSADVPLSAAKAGERQKAADFTALCRAANMDFVPMVWEVFGGASPSTAPLFKDLVSRVDRDQFTRPNWAASTPSAYWQQRLSLVLQRYSARKVEHLAAVCRQTRRLAPC